MLESQSDFARRLGVSKQAVHGYLKNGQVKGAALVPNGKRVQIDVEIALEQLRGNLDPYQRLANGRAEIGKRNSVNKTAVRVGEPLSEDAEKVLAVLLEIVTLSAWEVAEPGGRLQACFDIFANLRLNAVGEMRIRSFVVDETDFTEPDWRGLAEEIGLDFTDPAAMHADWNRRRLAPD